MAASQAQIQAALAAAKQNELSWTDEATLARAAIRNQFFDSNGNLVVPITSANRDGVEVNWTLEQAQKWLAFCMENANGGLVAQYVEFRPQNTYPGIFQ